MHARLRGVMVTTAALAGLALAAHGCRRTERSVRGPEHGLQQHRDRAGRARRPAAGQPVGAGAPVPGRRGGRPTRGRTRRRSRRRPTSQRDRRRACPAARRASCAGAGGTQLPDPGPAGRIVELHLQHAGRRDPRLARRHPPTTTRSLGISRASVGAVYMGLAIATPSAATGPRLYAADFANNRIDIVNSAVAARRRAGRVRGPEPARRLRRVRDPDGRQPDHRDLRPPGAPAGIRELPGAGLGVVNAFDLNGNFLARVASPGGVLNAPWGTAMAHPNFGTFGGDLLIGNFGDGRINAFHENADGTWTPSGTLKGINGQPLFIGGLWALQFGKGDAASGASTTCTSPPGRTARPRACSGGSPRTPMRGSATCPAPSRRRCR